MSEQKIQAIDHIVFTVFPETAQARVDKLAATLGIDLPSTTPMSPAIRVWINLDAGIEVVAPVARAGSPEAPPGVDDVLEALYTFLDTRGEGVSRVVFGVQDLDASLERASSLGSPLGWKFTSGPEDLMPNYSAFEEADIDEIAGVAWMFSRIVPAGKP